MRKTLSLGAAALAASLAAEAAADELRVLDQANGIARFDTDTGEVRNYKSITGLLPGERVKAIDTGRSVLYGLTDERLYTIDPITAVAAPAGPRFAQGISLSTLDPVPFEFRYDSSEALILRGTRQPGAGPATGTMLVLFDADSLKFEDVDRQTGSPRQLAYVAGDPAFGLGPVVTALTQRIVTDGSGTHEILGIDTARRSLVRIGGHDTDPRSPEALELRTIAPLTGFVEQGEHVITMEATLTGTLVGKTILLTTSPTSPALQRIYGVDVATGAVTKVGELLPSILIDLAEAPSFPSGPAVALDLSRARVAMDVKHKNRDTATIVGLLDIPDGGWAGRTVRVDFGGIVREFVLDARGRGVSGADSFKVAARPTKSGWPFTIKLAKGSFAQPLGVLADQPIGTVDVVLDLFVVQDLYAGQSAHRTQFRMDYFVKRNGRGAATRREP